MSDTKAPRLLPPRSNAGWDGLRGDGMQKLAERVRCADKEREPRMGANGHELGMGGGKIGFYRKELKESG